MKEDRPNVILITVDSLRADHLGCYGYSKPTSLNIDRFARESCLFMNAFSTGPNTPHAFPSIMASRYPLMSPRLGLFDAPVTLAEVLQSAGYMTAGFNAANPYISKYFHYDRGFEEFYDYLDFEIPTPWDQNGGETAKSAFGNISVPTLDIDRYVVSEESIRRKVWLESSINADIFQWLEARARAPFFLWVHYMDPHYPYVPEQSHQLEMEVKPFGALEMLQINRRIRENSVFSAEGLRRTIDLYDCAIRQLDAKIGELLKFLQRQDWYDSSLVIITADHGEEFQEHGDLQHRSKLYDELIRVPLMLKLPGLNRPAVSTDIVGLIGVAPTIVTCLALGNPFESTSFFDRPPDSNGAQRSWVIAEACYGVNSATPVDEQLLNVDGLPKVYCCREKNWKLILDKGKGRLYLFNLLIDPKEKNAYYYKEIEQAQRIGRRLEEHIKSAENKQILVRIKRTREKLNSLNQLCN